MVCGIYLTRKMAMVTMPTDQFLEQKKQLWAVILAFETEAIISIVYDVLLDTVGSRYTFRGCGGILFQPNYGSVLVFVLIRSVRLFLAIWSMLYLFDSQSTDYSETTDYTYDPEDSLDEYMAGLQRPSIAPYGTEVGYDDAREPLLNIQGNTFEDYLQGDDAERFGERTNRQISSQGGPSPGAY